MFQGDLSPLSTRFIIEMCATSVAAWVWKLDINRSSDDTAGMLLRGASEEGSEMAEVSFQYCSYCHARIAVCEVCGVGTEAWSLAEADGWTGWLC